MYRITIAQGENQVSYSEDSVSDIAELVRILLFDDTKITINISKI